MEQWVDFVLGSGLLMARGIRKRLHNTGKKPPLIVRPISSFVMEL
jgi:hypothetical protein